MYYDEHHIELVSFLFSSPIEQRKKKTIIYFRSIFEWNSMVNEQISALGDKTDGILGRQKKRMKI